MRRMLTLSFLALAALAALAAPGVVRADRDQTSSPSGTKR